MGSADNPDIEEDCCEDTVSAMDTIAFAPIALRDWNLKAILLKREAVFFVCVSAPRGDLTSAGK